MGSCLKAQEEVSTNLVTVVGEYWVQPLTVVVPTQTSDKRIERAAVAVVVVAVATRVAVRSGVALPGRRRSLLRSSRCRTSKVKPLSSSAHSP